MSRLLSLLLLYKNGFDAGKYVSFEEQINNYKAYYYEALRQSSAGWEMNENSYFPFIENFLSTLYMCYKELDKRFAVVHDRPEQPDAAIQSRDLQNSPRCQPHNRRSRSRSNGQDRFGKADRCRTDNTVY